MTEKNEALSVRRAWLWPGTATLRILNAWPNLIQVSREKIGLADADFCRSPRHSVTTRAQIIFVLPRAAATMTAWL